MIKPFVREDVLHFNPSREKSFALALALSWPTAHGEDLKSGPEKKIGGPFQVKAITGGQKGKTLCYI